MNRSKSIVQVETTSPTSTTMENVTPNPSYDILRISTPKSQQTKSVIFNDTIRMAHKIARIFGQLPFSIKYVANDEIDGIYATTFDVIWFIMAIFGYLFLFYSIVTTFGVSGELQTLILFIVARVIVAGDLILSATAIVLDMINRFRLIRIAQELKSFDKEVNLSTFTFI